MAQGYTQTYELNYGNTFSLVAKMTIVCLFFVVSTICHWHLHQLDIKNVFPDDLEKEIYMEQTCGFVAGLVCKLHQSLCGLKQSPHAWLK